MGGLAPLKMTVWIGLCLRTRTSDTEAFVFKNTTVYVYVGWRMFCQKPIGADGDWRPPPSLPRYGVIPSTSV